MEVTTIEGHSDLPIAWGIAQQTMPGCNESGDQYLIKPFSTGALAAVVDGLGHGDKAASVAKAAMATLAAFTSDSVSELMTLCHKELVGTRGAVMSLALFNTSLETMTWLGVGNVAGLLLRTNSETPLVRERLLLRGGILGYQMPTLRPVTLPIQYGDVLVFATDGIRSEFSKGLPLDGSPQDIADHILTRYGRGTDDTLVLVARYIGPLPTTS